MLSLVDAGDVVLAVFAGGVVVVAPGLALIRIFRIERVVGSPCGCAGVLAGTVAGLAALPLIDSLTIRWLGPTAALLVSLALAVYAGLAALRDGNPKPWLPGRQAVLLALGWLLVLIVESVDFDVGARLYQPFTVIDMVKHAATTQAILDSGAPPHDPFFMRPERVGYYYFFYALPALAVRLGMGVIDSRYAVCGVAFWTGIGLLGLVRLAIERCGGARATGDSIVLGSVAILVAGGLDILGFLRMGLLQGTWLADPVAWNEQITGWTESLLWVPHHVVGLIAGMVGLIALGDTVSRRDGGAPAGQLGPSIIFAALCFASAFGLSTWILLALVCTVAAWLGLLLFEQRWPAAFCIAAAALLAIGFAVPQVLDLVAGRDVMGASPIVVPTVRAFSPVDGLVPAGGWRLAARALALPLNYFASFGILASGAILYWRERGAGPAFPTEFARCLAIAALAGLLLGGFLKSTLFNNDLGWRVMLFPLFAGTVWTILAIDRRQAAASVSRWRMVRSLPRAMTGLLILGWATTLCGLVTLRAYPLMPVETDHRFLAAHPETERGLRLAYEWADRNLDPRAIVQHDPTRPRAVAFALYGRHRVAVADAYGSLFGADPRAVDARVRSLAPIFHEGLSPAQVHSLLMSNGIDDLVVTKDDPIWAISDAFVWRVTPVYASDAVRIVSRVSLEGTPPGRLSISAATSNRQTKDN